MAVLSDFIGANERRIVTDGPAPALAAARRFAVEHPELADRPALVAHLVSLEERAREAERGRDEVAVQRAEDTARLAAATADVERLLAQKRRDEALRMAWDIEALLVDPGVREQAARLVAKVQRRRTVARWSDFRPVLVTPAARRRVIVPTTPSGDPERGSRRWTTDTLAFGAPVWLLARAGAFVAIARVKEGADAPAPGLDSIEGWLPRGALADEDRFTRERDYLARLAAKARSRETERLSRRRATQLGKLGRDPLSPELQLDLVDRGHSPVLAARVAVHLDRQARAASPDGSLCVDLAPVLQRRKLGCGELLGRGLRPEVLSALVETYPLAGAPLDSGVHRNLARFLAATAFPAAFADQAAQLGADLLQVTALRLALERESLLPTH
jgi:hypothetical protein